MSYFPRSEDCDMLSCLPINAHKPCLHRLDVISAIHSTLFGGCVALERDLLGGWDLRFSKLACYC